jgi:hypothetical protein
LAIKLEKVFHYLDLFCLVRYGTSTVAAGSDTDSDADNKREKLLMLLNGSVHCGGWLSESDKIGFLKPQISEAYSQLIVVIS